VPELSTTSSLACGFPKVWLTMLRSFDNIGYGRPQKLSGILGDLNINHLTIDGTGYEDDSALVAGYKNSTVGNFFNFDSKIHSHSVPQLTCLT